MKKYISTVREQLSIYGAGAEEGLDLQSLLAILIGPKATPELCGQLSAYGIRSVAEMSLIELVELGLSNVEAQRVFAGFELARKWVSSSKERSVIIRSPEDAFNQLKLKIGREKQEHFYALYLNTKHEVIYEENIFTGSLNCSIVHPRELFHRAVKHSAACIIVAHNHPSNDTTPSVEDVDVTRRLIECGKIMGIDVLDHIIVGEDNYTSIKEKGFI